MQWKMANKNSEFRNLKLLFYFMSQIGTPWKLQIFIALILSDLPKWSDFYMV